MAFVPFWFVELDLWFRIIFVDFVALTLLVLIQVKNDWAYQWYMIITKQIFNFTIHGGHFQTVSVLDDFLSVVNFRTHTHAHVNSFWQEKKISSTHFIIELGNQRAHVKCVCFFIFYCCSNYSTIRRLRSLPNDTIIKRWYKRTNEEAKNTLMHIISKQHVL